MSDFRSKLAAEFLADEDYAYGYCDDFLNVYIATQIKVLREQRGFAKQTEFAKESGISQEQISQMESIDRNSWTIATLRKFARALGVTLRVSFESFSDRIETIARFSRPDLQKPSRVDDLSKYSQPSVAGEINIRNRTLIDTLRDASQTNVASTAAPSTGNFSQKSIVAIIQSGKPLYETLEDQPSESDLALPFERSQSAREGLGEKRIH